MNKKIDKKYQELEKLAKPINDWLYENGCPHTTVKIDMSGVKVTTDEAFITFELRD